MNCRMGFKILTLSQGKCFPSPAESSGLFQTRVIENLKNGKRDRNSLEQCVRAMQSDEDASFCSGQRKAVSLYFSFLQRRHQGWGG